MPTYTYTATIPTDKDFVRLWAGDRDVSGTSATAVLSDQEIAAILAVETNKWFATASAIEMMRAKLALTLGAGGALIEKQVEDLRERFADAGTSGNSADDRLAAYLVYLRTMGARATSKQPCMFRVLRSRT